MKYSVKKYLQLLLHHYLISSNDLSVTRLIKVYYYYCCSLLPRLMQCRLIIAQMSGHRCELINMLLVPLAIAVVVSLFLPKYEPVILYTYALVVVCAHLHYGISAVGELCEHFHIYCFSLMKKEPTS